MPTAAEIDRLRRQGELDRAEALAGHDHSADDTDLRIVRGRLSLARHRYDEALALFADDDDRLLAWRVATLSRTYRDDEAFAVAAEAITRYPDSVPLRLALGRAHLDAWRPREALAAFTEARRLAPDDWRTTGWLAVALANLTRLDEAKATAAEAVRSHPGTPKAHYVLGRVHSASYEFAEAVACYDAALDLDPRYPDAFEWKITALRLQHRYDEAERVAGAAVAAVPSVPRLHVEHAWVLSDQHRHDEALAAVDRALALDPAHRWALESRIDLLQSLGRTDDALEQAADAADRHPSDVMFLVSTAWLHAARDEHDRAMEHLDRAAAITPTHESVVRSRISILVSADRYDEAEAAAGVGLAHYPDDPDLQFTLAGVHLGRGETDLAVACCDRALAGVPRHAPALRRKIMVLRDAGRSEEALETGERALAWHPRDPAIHLALARLHADEGRHGEALDHVERALVVTPRDTNALQARIDCLGHLGRREEAAQAGRDAVALRPDDPDLGVEHAWALSALDLEDEAVEAVTGALRLSPDHAWALRSRVRFLTYAKRFDEAASAAADAVRRQPDDAELHVTIARLHIARGRLDEAVASAERALALEPRHSGAHSARIVALDALGRVPEALLAAEAAAEQQPEDVSTLLRLADAYSQAGRHDDAVTATERALAIEPEDRDAVRNLIGHLREARRFDEAGRAAEEALARITDDPDLHVTVAWLHADRHRVPDALTSVDAALALDPEHEWALRSRTALLHTAGRVDEALETAARAAALHPDSSSLHVTAAELAAARHLVDEALTHLDRASAVDPAAALPHRRRIRVLRLARRFDEAGRAADEALARFPDDADLRVDIAWLHSDLGRGEAAFAEVERALELRPEHEWAWRTKVSLLRAARRYPEALVAADRMLDVRRDEPDVLVTAAWLHGDMGDLDRVLVVTGRALELDRGHVAAYEARVAALILLNRFEEAEETARQALVNAPGVVDLHVLLAKVHDHVRAFDRAEEQFAAARAVDPFDEDLVVAQSATLRTLRRLGEAERLVAEFCARVPHLRGPRFELGWIHHDARRLGEARRVFAALLADARDDYERAASHHALGWVAFTGDDLVTAEKEFRAALVDRPEDYDYVLALVWALARQDGERRWREAEGLAGGLLDRRVSAAVHVCLGVLAFRRGALASAEYHLRQALEVDPHHGSHADLGALYVQMGRYEEAEVELGKAVERDWYDVNAHVELGALFLQLGEERLSDAEREFRQAAAIDPASGAAAIGLAQALARAGDEAEAESVLRQAEQRQDASRKWRTHLALARLLVQRGDKQQNPDLHAEAYAQAQSAIETAPDAEADPHFVAGVAHHRMGSLAADARGRFGYRLRAMHHLRECLKRSRGHVEAQRNLQLLERELKAVAPAIWGGYAVATISLLLLGTMWTAFFFSSKVTAVMLTATTPVLVGLFTVAVLLPALIRLKLPGFEADLQAGGATVSPGPTGQVTFGPGRLTVTSGPTGQLPRRE
ncbi:tetratricopeptide repeat protein [Actinosynnema sp. NPDC002837]